jgi:hypothetical protein
MFSTDAMVERLASWGPPDLGLAAFGSQRSNDFACRLYSLMLTCKQCGADPEANIEGVLVRVSKTPAWGREPLAVGVTGGGARRRRWSTAVGHGRTGRVHVVCGWTRGRFRGRPPLWWARKETSSG